MPNDVEGLRDGADTAAAAVTGTGSAAGVAQETSDRAEAATVEPIEARDAEHFGNLVREMNSGTTPMAPIFAQGINLQNIDLRGLVIPPGSDFYGAELDKADFTNATLAGVILDGASLQYACFLGTIFCKDGNDGPTNLASIYGADFKWAIFSPGTVLRGMPLWQAQNLSNTVLKADTEQPHIDHGVDITRILLGHRFTMEPLKNSTTRIFRLTHKEFLEIMPEIMGIKSLPDLSEQHPEAYRVRDGREFNAIATRMHYGHAPVRAIDASGADLGDMTFGEFFSDGDIFVDGADLRRTRFHRDRQASGQRLSMNRSIVGLGDFDLKNWLDSSCEFDVVRVHLTSLYVTDELLERARQYDQDARDDGIITLTRAEFAEWLARDWYGIEDFR